MVDRPSLARLRRRALLAGLGASAIGGGAAWADVVPSVETPPAGVTDPAPPAPQAQPAAERERWIWVQNNAGEEVAVAYRAGQNYNVAALVRLQRLFRDLRAETAGPIPALLVDMLSLLQERFGYTRPLKLISGYRTPQTNATLPFAAPNSLHMRGMAADIIVPGFSQTDVVNQAMALSNMLGFMGIGWYGSFTHVDIGPKANWARMIN
jgi:uncharacterized protein YcbK (DUF882 family)